MPNLAAYKQKLLQLHQHNLKPTLCISSLIKKKNPTQPQNLTVLSVETFSRLIYWDLNIWRLLVMDHVGNTTCLLSNAFYEQVSKNYTGINKSIFLSDLSNTVATRRWYKWVQEIHPCSLWPAVFSVATTAMCGNPSQLFSTDFWACFSFSCIRWTFLICFS